MIAIYQAEGSLEKYEKLIGTDIKRIADFTRADNYQSDSEEDEEEEDESLDENPIPNLYPQL